MFDDGNGNSGAEGGEGTPPEGGAEGNAGGGTEGAPPADSTAAVAGSLLDIISQSLGGDSSTEGDEGAGTPPEGSSGDSGASGGNTEGNPNAELLAQMQKLVEGLQSQNQPPEKDPDKMTAQELVAAETKKLAEENAALKKALEEQNTSYQSTVAEWEKEKAAIAGMRELLAAQQAEAETTAAKNTAEKWKDLGIDVDKTASTLAVLRRTDKDAAELLEQQMNTAMETLAQKEKAFTQPAGHGFWQPPSKDMAPNEAMEKLNTLAAEKIKAEPHLSTADALALVGAENLELVAKADGWAQK